MQTDMEIISLSEVKKLLHLKSDSSIYCKLNPKYPNLFDPSFPKPFKIGARTFWVKTEIDDWIKNKIIEARS
ncbi:helix-turn-helix transcriptional regulator [Brackiella oedipodis]|uniref:helix-turn-helix transcriptional regulator n=1 Tax=Brackiella oedipodis TaxID=124225 RepID=UPI00048FABEE|nr:AlpA family phage regulatory protein [Brackiella oedipodis]